jgi:hypothetical protein
LDVFEAAFFAGVFALSVFFVEVPLFAVVVLEDMALVVFVVEAPAFVT